MTSGGADRTVRTSFLPFPSLQKSHSDSAALDLLLIAQPPHLPASPIGAASLVRHHQQPRCAESAAQRAPFRIRLPGALTPGATQPRAAACREAPAGGRESKGGLAPDFRCDRSPVDDLRKAGVPSARAQREIRPHARVAQAHQPCPCSTPPSSSAATRPSPSKPRPRRPRTTRSRTPSWATCPRRRGSAEHQRGALDPFSTRPRAGFGRRRDVAAAGTDGLGAHTDMPRTGRHRGDRTGQNRGAAAARARRQSVRSRARGPLEGPRRPSGERGVPPRRQKRDEAAAPPRRARRRPVRSPPLRLSNGRASTAPQTNAPPPRRASAR